MNKYCDYDHKTLTKLHQVQLEILDEFVKICNENNLTYFLIGGTYLGCLRHRGFIPWDDDVDVALPRKDYNKFIEVAKTKLNKKYYLECYDTDKECYYPYAKIKKNHTVFDEEVLHHLNNHKGIFIDIFVLDNVDDINLRFKINAVMAMSITDTLAIRNKIDRKVLHPLLVVFLKLFPSKILIKWQKKCIAYCKNDDSKYLCDIGTGYGYRREMLLRSDVLPVRKLMFEGKEYSCMQTDQYLKNIYGDYMKLPPKEKRRNHMPLEIKFGEVDE